MKLGKVISKDGYISNIETAFTPTKTLADAYENDEPVNTQVVRFQFL